MKSFVRPFLLIAITTILGFLAAWPPHDKIKLGIDLSGGTILVYQAKETADKTFNMDDLITALKKRINPEGLKDIVVRKVGSNRVEIILPKAAPEEVEDIKRRMTAVGSMQFRILADSRDASDEQPIQRATAEGGLLNPPAKYRWAKLAEIVEHARKDAGAGAWVRIEGNRLIDPSHTWERDHYAGAMVTLKAKSAEGTRSASYPVLGNDLNTLVLDPSRATVMTAGKETVRRRPSVAADFSDIESYTITLNPSRILADPNLAIRSVPRGNGVEERYVLYKVEPESRSVTGDMLESVYPTTDEKIQPAVGFIFKASGANKFGRLTREFSPVNRGGDFYYHLAILLDDVVMSAPIIKQEISNQGIIEGMPPKQRDELIDILRAGKLPASIDPIPLQQANIGPTLGKDTIDKGVRAIGWSMVIVPIFMILYYRFAGAVSVVALFLNMILLVGSMAFTNSSITLPGLAGLALTIGMAVDANVLVFERMREEKERGANLATQIRNGFDRAWTTILDSHVTTLVSGMVMWAIGTEEVKGFALTLIIGLAWNLFTAVYVSRVIFEFSYRKGWLKNLKMMKLLGNTNIDFVRPRRLLMGMSVVLILMGLAKFFSNTKDKFNIDFTGGTLVTIALNPSDSHIESLNEAGRVGFVRDQATEAQLPNVAVESLSLENEKRGTRFNIRTTEVNPGVVQQAILKQFGSALSRLTMDYGTAQPIPKSEKADLADRFAGGTSYTLAFSREVDPELLRISFVNYLREMKAEKPEDKITNPESRFEIERVRRPGGSPGTESAEEQLIFRTNLDPAQADRVLSELKKSLPNDPALNFLRLENFGAAVAGDTQIVAILAIVTSWLAIILYLWFRFKSVTFGLAAVIALVHDVLIALGAVAFSNYKIDLPMIAAFLTIIGFSTNDTIVIFDRIREIKGKTPYLTEGIINAAVNQTLSRTILTSFTALLVVLIMYLFGGEALNGFSFCLLVGFISGIYSTVYIASPILIDWMGKPPATPATRGALASAAK
jgi:SecD/SecF fusion protein